LGLLSKIMAILSYKLNKSPKIKQAKYWPVAELRGIIPGKRKAIYEIERFVMCEQCGCGESAAEQSFEEKVKSVINVIRPNLQDHGGDIELVGTDEDNCVRVRLQGACSGCPGAAMTLKMGVERLLKEKIPEVKEVIAVN
jgi:Fe-S cluster biogenesis protein NfuA